MATRSGEASLPLNANEEAFLRAFARAILSVPRALDADLLREQGMSMSEYSALMFLSESPGRRLRMGDLALQARSLVRRERCSSDARGWEAVLTNAGFERLQQAWPTHLASVRRHVIDHVQSLDLIWSGLVSTEHIKEIGGLREIRSRRDRLLPFAEAIKGSYD